MSAAVVAALTGWATAIVATAVAVGLRAAAGRRAELVARACHEVQGPITAARLAAHLAGRGAGADGPLRAIDEELEQAGRLVADLAGAGQGRAPALRREDVDVRQLLRRVRDAWRPAARLRGRDVSIAADGGGLVVRGDGGRLQQALSNLVANALDHGAGTVVVAARARAGRLRIEVADGGPGLPAPAGVLAAAAPRAGAVRRGRGLAVAAEVASRHGGRLEDAAAGVALDLPLESPADGDARA